MKIAIITPVNVRSHSGNGNRNTALRWGQMLRQLGYQVTIAVEWDDQPVNLMLALHARKSHASIKRYADTYPGAPLILALTGTDLYRDIRTDKNAQESMRLATRMIVLQDMGLSELAPAPRKKTRVIYQSAEPTTPRLPLKTRFEVCVIGHLREEKDPFRGALALPHLPQDSLIHMIHMGRAMSAEMETQAKKIMAHQPRYRWLGEMPHWKVRVQLARSRLMLISSRMEGGANVVSEALTANVPVIASNISGNIGMLGKDYAGYYPVENERALAKLLHRAETDAAFYRLLKKQCTARKPLITPLKELNSLKQLIEEVTS